MAKARRKWQAKKPVLGNSSGTTATKKYQAPTLNYEDVVLSADNTKDAALFQDVVSKLSLYVGTKNWKISTVLSKAMEDLENSVFVDTVRLVRQYMTGAGGARVQTTARMTMDRI